MGIFTRTRDILNSNINAALDRAEDPEKLVRQMVREMEDTLVELKAACAGAMAGMKRAQRNLGRAQERSAHWAARAELAVAHGREDLARNALRAKRNYQDETDGVAKEATRLEGLVNEYKDDIVQIEDKLATARDKERVLVQRHIHAVRKVQAQRHIRRLDTSSAFLRFEQVESRIERAEADAELVNYGRSSTSALEDEFRNMERDETIEQELDALRQKRDSAHLVTA